MLRTLVTLGVCLVFCAGLALWLGQGKPITVIGLFFVNGLAVGSLYALGGIGLVVLYQATGVLNLAAGAIGAGAIMGAWQLAQWGVPAPVTWIAGLCLGVLLALIYGRGVSPFLSDREPAVKAVASLAYALILLGLISFFWVDDTRSFGFPTDKTAVKILGLRITVTRLILIGSAIVIAVLIGLALTRTRMGLNMRALANNRALSSLIGIPILRVEMVAWTIAGALFGFTGLMFGSLVRLDPAVITFLVIPCVAAAIFGRLDSLPTVLIGGLTIGVTESLMTLSPTFKDIRPMTPFVLAALVLFILSRGHRLTFAEEKS